MTKCPYCKKEINLGKMMAQLSLKGKTKEELRERTRKAVEASRIARSKKKKKGLSPKKTGQKNAH